MTSRGKMKLNRLIMAGAIASALAACGGSSDTTTPSPSTSATHSISGSAAVGAPLVGSVTVKDALGATKTVSIGTNGAYQVDVTGMTAPFVFRASGTANGQTYVVHSIATAADADGKINITQLTDLVVANIAGQIAQNYFDKFEQNSNATAATKTAIDAEVNKLKEKLLPVLTALGVEASVDLLRTPFTPLADKLDKALDVLRVSVDPENNVATISNVINGATIEDKLTEKASVETATTLDSSNVSATAADDAFLIKKALSDFSAKFASGLPSASDSSLTSLFSDNFLNDDQNLSTFLNWITTESNLVGGSFTDVNILQIDTTSNIARVSFTAKTKNGVELGRLQNWKLIKVNGVWRIHGNQQVLELEGFASATKLNFGSSSCVNVGLNFNIEDHVPTNNGGTIDHILVTGPGLPSGGLRYNKPTLDGRWANTATNQSHYTMASDCTGATTGGVSDQTIAAIPDDAIYTFEARNNSDVKVSFPRGTTDGTYKIKIRRRPMTLAEAKASTAFPVISQNTVSALPNFTGGTLQFAATNVNPNKSAWVHLIQNTALATSARDVEVTVIPTTSGGVTTTGLSLPQVSNGDQVTSTTLWIESPDAYRRNMQTLYDFQFTNSL